MNIYRQILQRLESGRPFAVGVVLSAEGSTPREAGVRAVFDATGRITGTLGGGLVEAQAQRAAARACETGQPCVLEVALAGSAVEGLEPICGGRMRMLLDPTAWEGQAAYAAAAQAAESRGRGLLVTVVRSGEATRTEVHWRAEEHLTGLPPPHPLVTPRALTESLASEAVLLLREDDAEGRGVVEALLEPVACGPRLLIVGGGHVGQALAQQAVLVGFEVTILDDRPEFTAAELFPEEVATRCCGLAGGLAADPLGPDTYVVIVTRGHQHDAAALRACLGRPAAYLGMIGSRRKVALLRQGFLEAGWATQEQLDRVFAPIGVNIGAETVPEIAASITAQLVAVRRRGWEQARSVGAMPR